MVYDGIHTVCRLEGRRTIVGLEHHSDPIECIWVRKQVGIVCDKQSILALCVGHDVDIVDSWCQLIAGERVTARPISPWLTQSRRGLALKCSADFSALNSVPTAASR